MPQALVVPGVSVATRFEVRPPLPSRTGILGAVGIVDLDPGEGPVAVTTSQELLALFGPATRYSFPEALSALANGVSQLIVSPVDESAGVPAALELFDDELPSPDKVALLRARAVGPWGNRLSVRVTRAFAADGVTVSRVHLDLLYDGAVIERHRNLVFRAGDDNDFFRRINAESQTIVALDPVFMTDLPALLATATPIAHAPAQAAIGTIVGSGGPLIDLEATDSGEAGNGVAFSVAPGRASRSFPDAEGNAALTVRAADAGSAGTSISVEIVAAPGGGISLTVGGMAGGPAVHVAETLTALVDALAAHGQIVAEATGAVLPVATGGALNLEATVSVTVERVGVSTSVLSDLASAQAIVDALNDDGHVQAALRDAGDADLLPLATSDNAGRLHGGRDAGRALGLRGRTNTDDDVAVLVPAPSAGADATRLRVRVLTGSRAGTVRLVVGVQTDDGFAPREDFDGLTMDPDPKAGRYLVTALAEDSTLVRAIDRFRPAGAKSWPRALSDAKSFAGGASPGTGAWTDAVDALAAEEAVDMLLAGLQGWADADLDHLAVQRHMLGHARAQADKARPRIVIGSIAPSEEGDVKAIVAHAGEVGDRRFVLCTPAGSEGAVAGLLGHLEYFQSPTFKGIAALGVPLHRYRDGELDKLVGEQGNLCVVQKRRGRGTICLKGISTTGDQISVTRTADVCVRRVQAIADRFIGELNNADARNALKQMIVATFTQMERDGALVPSVDGESPAFQVDVYSSQTDFAAGIVRIDVAVRPVRAIDYVYATITVKN